MKTNPTSNNLSLAKSTSINESSNNKKTLNLNKDELVVVGIGASAGGLEAFTAMIKEIP